MKLQEQQQRFAHMLALLILKANEMGFEVTLGEAYRPQFVADIYASQGKGVKSSFHTKRLAIDLNLFKDGVYLTKTEDYRPLGEWWLKEYAPMSAWGGLWQDYVHFSFEHDGRK